MINCDRGGDCVTEGAARRGPGGGLERTTSASGTAQQQGSAGERAGRDAIVRYGVAVRAMPSAVRVLRRVSLRTVAMLWPKWLPAAKASDANLSEVERTSKLILP